MNEIIARRLRVHGRVQGVGFRFYTVREALARNLTGWVRNRTDGTVEIQAQGRPGEVDDFQRWVSRGPESARVDRVEANDASPEALTGFCELDTL
ncbi:acylphosphatase [Jeongeupia chitinilytica]|uniref:Acylphosphatase n=1 Tax=Jeongeupia chitinilytica TaxID=1041641 RepID=A0ABQ3GXH9_9NEIS|nr:acylphosphatase [Jeongeupia chitinilytica]GHD58496.1 acylphosphatase [Jeongeupia chitinilytica]